MKMTCQSHVTYRNKMTSPFIHTRDFSSDVNNFSNVSCVDGLFRQTTNKKDDRIDR